jgi:hypothetical protein
MFLSSASLKVFSQSEAGFRGPAKPDVSLFGILRTRAILSMLDNGGAFRSLDAPHSFLSTVNASTVSSIFIGCSTCSVFLLVQY